MPVEFVEWSLNPLTPPWGNAPSIYLHIRDNPNSSELPDEKRDPQKIRFAAGAWDGVMGHHVGDSDPGTISQRADKVEQALENLLRFSTNENLKSLYNAVISEQMFTLADELSKRVAERVPHAQSGVAAVGRYFALGADQREATKFGIILLAGAGDRSDLKILETLARHDEFTLFAAVASTRLVDDPEQCVWRLARKVHGWGRIQLVERLDGTGNPEIQQWMLREGFRNKIMTNYLAEICARTGKLHEALQQAVIDPELLDSAADLLRGLLEAGPSAGMDDYEHAPAALQGYLNHVSQAHSPRLEHFLAVDEILSFLEDAPKWEERLARGWTSRLRDDLRESCKAVLGRDIWLPLAEKELDSDNAYRFYLADTVASRLGRNTWDVNFKQVRREPLKTSWYRLMQLTDEGNIGQVLDFAVSVLPLDSIATGPAEDLWPQVPGHQALEWILQELPRFPWRGWPLIKAGLQSRVTRNRNMGLNALLAWPREDWPADAFAVLQQASRLEPNEELRKRLIEAVKVH